MVDVRFLINIFTQPYLLEPGVIIPRAQLQDIRLLWDTIAPTKDPKQHLWILQWRNIGNEQQPIDYCFTVSEFFFGNYKIMNYYTYKSPKSYFTQVVVLAKFTQLKDQGPLVGSFVLFNGKVKQQIRAAERGIIQRCLNKSKKITVLKNYFDINFSKKREARYLRHQMLAKNLIFCRSYIIDKPLTQNCI